MGLGEVDKIMCNESRKTSQIILTWLNFLGVHEILVSQKLFLNIHLGKNKIIVVDSKNTLLIILFIVLYQVCKQINNFVLKKGM